MENLDIKRGVDFKTRFGEQLQHLDKALRWGKGHKRNKKSLLYLFIICVINCIIVFPIVRRNVSASYASSFSLMTLADFFRHFFIPGPVFFTILTGFVLLFAPLSVYVFVRKVAMRHEMTAFLAALCFILPNPLFHNVPVLVDGIVNGDGAHICAFVFSVLLLMHIRTFLHEGKAVSALLCAAGIGLLVILSPFAGFNILIFCIIFTIAEGFLGSLRVKIMRFGFLLAASLLLSLFWYLPLVMANRSMVSHIQFALERFWILAPLAVPVFPVAGVLSFLIFDRREKLQPVFISLAVFFTYTALFSASRVLNMNGIFTAQRYLPEFSLSLSLFAGIIFVLLGEYLRRTVLAKKHPRAIFPAFLTGCFAGSFLIAFLVLRGFFVVQTYAQIKLPASQSQWMGEVGQGMNFRTFPSILASLVSLATLFFLLRMVSLYPRRRMKN